MRGTRTQFTRRTVFRPVFTRDAFASAQRNAQIRSVTDARSNGRSSSVPGQYSHHVFARFDKTRHLYIPCRAYRFFISRFRFPRRFLFRRRILSSVIISNGSPANERIKNGKFPRPVSYHSVCCRWTGTFEFRNSVYQ